MTNPCPRLLWKYTLHSIYTRVPTWILLSKLMIKLAATGSPLGFFGSWNCVRFDVELTWTGGTVCGRVALSVGCAVNETQTQGATRVQPRDWFACAVIAKCRRFCSIRIYGLAQRRLQQQIYKGCGFCAYIGNDGKHCYVGLRLSHEFRMSHSVLIHFKLLLISRCIILVVITY